MPPHIVTCAWCDVSFHGRDVVPAHRDGQTQCVGSRLPRIVHDLTRKEFEELKNRHRKE